MKKKFLLILITATLALSVIVLVGCENSDIPATEGLKYEKIDGKNEYMLSSMDMATDTNRVIASTYNGMPVTAIGEWAFSGCSSLGSITLPSSVTSIGNYAFADCSSLTIYCETTEKPDGWNSDWNYSNRPVVWDYKNN